MKLKKCRDCGRPFEIYNRTNKVGAWIPAKRCKFCLEKLAATKKYDIKISQPISANKKKLPVVPEELVS